MNKNILIFGAYGALGKGVTATLLKKDYSKYYLFGSDAEKNSVTDSRIVNINVSDLSVEANVQKLFSRVQVEENTPLFMFSTIGGFFAGVDLKDTKSSDWERMFNLNLKTNFHIAKHFIKLAEQNGGAACFTSALSGMNNEAGRIAYGASKSALIHMIRSLSEECASGGISVMGIAPHLLDTPANREWMNENEYHTLQKPEEIGELIHFLFSNYHYMTGNIITLKTRFRR